MKNDELRNKLGPIKNFLSICKGVDELTLKANSMSPFMYSYELHLLEGLRNKELSVASSALDAFNQIIKMCLTFLGDKALLKDAYNREFKINWR